MGCCGSRRQRQSYQELPQDDDTDGSPEDPRGEGSPKSRGPWGRDFLGVPLVVLLWAGVAYSLYVALTNLDLKRFDFYKDSSDRRCGVDEGVQSRRYLYLCRAGDDWDLNGTCVENCESPPADPADSDCEMYNATDWDGELCLPEGGQGRRKALATFFHGSRRMVALICEVPQSWHPLAISSVVSFALPMLVLVVVRDKAESLFRTSFLLCIGVPLLFGLVWVTFVYEQPSLLGGPIVDTSKTPGVLAIAWSITVLVVWVCNRRAIDDAWRNTRDACKCILETQHIWALLVVMALLQVALVAAWLVGAVQFIKLVKHADHSTLQKVSKVACFMLLGFWSWEFVSSFSALSISHAALEWRARQSDTERLRRRPEMWQHLGTIGVGSLLITLFWIPRQFMSFLHWTSSWFTTAGEADCTQYCSPAAFIDVALHGNSFLVAGRRAVEVLENKSTASGITSHTIWVLRMMTVGATGVVSAMVSLLIVWLDDGYSDDMNSRKYVADVVSYGIFAGVMGMLIATPMLRSLHHTALSLLFYQAVEETGYAMCSCYAARDRSPPSGFQALAETASQKRTLLSAAAGRGWLC